MFFTDKEVEKMQSILIHLEPKTIESIQNFSPANKFRTRCTFGVKNNRRQYNYIFQYYQNLSPARKKILEKRKKEVPYNLYYVELEYNFVCIGWKIN